MKPLFANEPFALFVSESLRCRRRQTKAVPAFQGHASILPLRAVRTPQRNRRLDTSVNTILNSTSNYRLVHEWGKSEAKHAEELVECIAPPPLTAAATATEARGQGWKIIRGILFEIFVKIIMKRQLPGTRKTFSPAVFFEKCKIAKMGCMWPILNSLMKMFRKGISRFGERFPAP